MSLDSRLAVPVVLWLGVVGRLAAQEPHPHQAEALGRVVFPGPCTPEAQTRFERAMALLHSFWWEEGGRAFRAVAASDSTCALAYWGLALNYWGNPFVGGPSGDDLRQGAVAAARARALGAPTARERGFLAATGALYRDHETTPPVATRRSRPPRRTRSTCRPTFSCGLASGTRRSPQTSGPSTPASSTRTRSASGAWPPNSSTPSTTWCTATCKKGGTRRRGGWSRRGWLSVRRSRPTCWSRTTTARPWRPACRSSGVSGPRRRVCPYARRGRAVSARPSGISRAGSELPEATTRRRRARRSRPSGPSKRSWRGGRATIGLALSGSSDRPWRRGCCSRPATPPARSGRPRPQLTSRT